MDTLYLDNAATTWPKPISVLDTYYSFLLNNGASPGRGGYQRAVAADKAIFSVREKLSKLIGSTYSSQVAFMSSATEALNTAIYGVLQPGDHVIASKIEHNSVIRPLYDLEKNREIQVTWLTPDLKQGISVKDVNQALQKNTKLVIATHASNVLGSIQSVSDIGTLTRKKNILFLVDASQTIGKVPIDVEEMNIDLLAFSCHKALFGPPGVGGLYVHSDCIVQPFKRGGTGFLSENEQQPKAMPTMLESGTMNSAGIVALGEGIDEVNRIGIGSILAHNKTLINTLVEGLRDIPQISIYSDLESPTGVLSFNVGDVNASHVSVLLDEEYDIQTRGGLHCAPKVHSMLGTQEQGAVRISLSAFSTVEEINAAMDALAELGLAYEKLSILI